MNQLTVLGLGYVGLPTAALFADAGVRVHGVDLNSRILDMINRGESPIEEPGLGGLIARVVKNGRLTASSSVEASEAFLIAVGTPLFPDHQPDLRQVESAASAIGQVLKPGNLVILESTVPPGATRNVVGRVLEKVSGLQPGKDFHLAHCAERAIPGSALREMVENDRIIGGLDDASAKAAAALYSRMVKGALFPTDVLTSETVKLTENTYRDINIAFANELARLCETVGADVWRVITFANRHPRVNVHKPGPGVGGHCIPIVPWFLSAAAPAEATLIRKAREINEDQTRRVVARSSDLLAAAPSPARVAVLGVAYKAGIDDARETPAIPIIEGLKAAGFDVRITDPHVQRFPYPLVSLEDALRGADLILALNEEKAYMAMDPQKVAALVRTPVLYDTRASLDVVQWSRAGFRVAVLGRPA